MEAVNEKIKLKRSLKVKARKEAQKATPVTEARAHLRHYRVSPRKVKPVLDLIRGKSVTMAHAILRNTSKTVCDPLIKLINSATANAENNHNLDPALLYVAECFVCEGPVMKRIRPAAKGRATRILKRTSHITVVLKERQED